MEPEIYTHHLFELSSYIFFLTKLPSLKIHLYMYSPILHHLFPINGVRMAWRLRNCLYVKVSREELLVIFLFFLFFLTIKRNRKWLYLQRFVLSRYCQLQQQHKPPPLRTKRKSRNNGWREKWANFLVDGWGIFVFLRTPGQTFKFSLDVLIDFIMKEKEMHCYSNAWLRH